MLSEPKQRARSKFEYFRIIRDVLGIVVILVLLFSFMGELSGI